MRASAVVPPDRLTAGCTWPGGCGSVRIHVVVQRVPFCFASHADDRLADTPRNSLVGCHQPGCELGSDPDQPSTRNRAATHFPDRLSALTHHRPRCRPGEGPKFQVRAAGTATRGETT